jgi:arylsulfatase A-like enzyme
MRTRRLLFCCCALVASLANCSSAQQPNVLLISIDTLRADHLSSYGYDYETSPFLDELAAQGTRFKNAFVNCHPTPPSHTTILSSRYQETHTVLLHPRKRGDVTPGRDHLVQEIPKAIKLLQEMLQDSGYATVGVVGRGFGTRVGGFERGFDDYYSPTDNKEGRGRLLKMIRKRLSEGRPIYAFFHTFAVHAPYLPPKRYQKMFGEETNEFRPTVKNIRKAASKQNLKDIAKARAMYDGEIRKTDDDLRKFFSSLEEIGFLSNALVIVTSDHGEEFGEHGGMMHGPKLYDELIHVPLILWGSGVPKGKVVERLVSSVDIVPTILDIVNVETDAHLEGENLLAPARLSPEDEVVFSQVAQSQYSVRTHRWKLITARRDNLPPSSPLLEQPIVSPVELYDLRDDPAERDNVAQQHPDQVKTLESLLASWKVGLDRTIKPGSTRIQTEAQRERLRALGYLE